MDADKDREPTGLCTGPHYIAGDLHVVERIPSDDLRRPDRPVQCGGQPSLCPIGRLAGREVERLDISWFFIVLKGIDHFPVA